MKKPPKVYGSGDEAYMSGRLKAVLDLAVKEAADEG